MSGTVYPVTVLRSCLENALRCETSPFPAVSGGPMWFKDDYLTGAPTLSRVLFCLILTRLDRSRTHLR